METKNCHFVQQAYLRFFASDPDETKIWQYNKKDNPTEELIEKVATIELFYPQWLEQYIGVFYENKGINALRSLVEKESFNDLDPNQKKIVCDWIYIQFVRTPTFEEHIAEFLNIYLNQEIHIIPQRYKDQFKGTRFDIRLIPELWELVKNDLWSYMVNKDNNFFRQMIDSKVWEVKKNQTSKKYYTSDNPVSITFQSERASIFQANITTPDNEDYFSLKLRDLRPHEDIAYYLPLTPELMLSIHRLEDKYCTSLVQEIGKINAMIAIQSSSVFSCVYDFDDAKNYEVYYQPTTTQKTRFEVIEHKDKEITPITLDALLTAFEKSPLQMDLNAIFGGDFTDEDSRRFRKFLRNIRKIKMDAFISVLRKNLTGKDRKVLDTLEERTALIVDNDFLSNFPAVFAILTSSIDKSLRLKIIKIISDNVDSML